MTFDTDIENSNSSDIISYIEQIIKDECEKANIDPRYVKIVNNKKSSKAVWICEPEWQLGNVGKLSQNVFTLDMVNEHYEVTLSIGRTDSDDFVPIPPNVLSKDLMQGKKSKTTLVFDEDNAVMRKYLKDVLSWEINHFYPSHGFGCCSKYVDCSDMRKCVHHNNLYAKGCAYRKNLEAGRIFYGKNINVE